MSLGLGEKRPSPLAQVVPGRALTGEDRLREAIRRYSRTKRRKGLTIDQKPGCIYGMLLGDDVKDLQRDLEEIKKTLRGIYVSVFLMLLGLIADIALRGLGVM
ncbi:MAG: hypothetical protein ACE5LG_07755 [Anaerolineae bacterium]